MHFGGAAKQGDCRARSMACADFERFDVEFGSFAIHAAKTAGTKHRMTARKRILPPPPKPARAPRRRGGQLGNRNAWKHGKFTGDIRALKADVWAYLRSCRALLEEVDRTFHLHPRRRKPPPDRSSPHGHLDRAFLTSVDELVDITEALESMSGVGSDELSRPPFVRIGYNGTRMK